MELSEEQQQLKNKFDDLIKQMKAAFSPETFIKTNDCNAVMFLCALGDSKDSFSLKQNIFALGNDLGLYNLLLGAVEKEPFLAVVIKAAATKLLDQSLDKREQVAAMVLKGEILIKDIAEMPNSFKLPNDDKTLLN